jgi:hypothetical protein
LGLYAGIKGRAIASILSAKFTRKKSPAKTVASSRAIIVGSHRECYDCYSIFKHAGNESSVVDWFDVANNKEVVAADLQKFCVEKSATMIVLCIGILSSRKIIDLVQALGPSFSYRFHAAGSKSIVGSDSKSDLGEVIP